ncbi:MAG: CDP-archaeol synthase [Candidatus Heimdallarchaeota archaeon]
MASDWTIELIKGFLFLAPAFFANSVATFTTGLGAIDRGKMFRDGKPILGKNKTIGGLLGAILGAGVLGMTVVLFFPDVFEEVDSRWNLINYIWYFGFVQGFAAMVGDGTGSFIKRRVNLKPGGPFPIMDQIGFVIFAFLILAIFVTYPLSWVYLVIPVALVIHFIANMVAYKMGWKDVWW